MTRRIAAVVSMVAGLALVLGAAPLPAGASNALATMTVTTRDDPADPVLLSTSTGRETDVTVNADGASDVVVTFSGVGLSFSTPVVNLGAVSGAKSASTEITALTGGLHTLNIQVTSSNSPPVNAALPYLWAPGGPPIPATGDLTGRNYGNVDLYVSNGGNSYEDRQLLSFLDDATAFIGAPTKGRPTCASGSDTKVTGCVNYRYDTATGLVTIGGVIGRVTPKTVYVNGIGRSDDSEGELFNERTFAQRIGYPSPGKKYGASWRFSYSQFLDSGPATVKLTLRKNGTFTLSYGYGDDDGKVTTRKGTYALTAPGRLRLKGAFGTELHTFAVRTDNNGKATPNKGIWFVLGKGKFGDAVPMKPVK